MMSLAISSSLYFLGDIRLHTSISEMNNILNFRGFIVTNPFCKQEAENQPHFRISKFTL